MDDEFTTNLRKQAFDIWISPEIERRRALGGVEDGREIWAAQVIMEPEGPTTVRLNEEVTGCVVLRSPEELEPGQEIAIADLPRILPEVQAFVLHENDSPNAGHLTLLQHAGGCFIAFDFRYNSQRIREYSNTCREFLDAAAASIDANRIKVFVANLHVAAELAAKALLIQHPGPEVLRSKKHELVKSRYNLAAKRGSTDPRFAKLLNELSELRNPARYSTEPIRLTLDEAKSMLQVAEEMYRALEAIPQMRASPPDA